MTQTMNSPDPRPLYWEDAAFQAADQLVASEAYKTRPFGRHGGPSPEAIDPELMVETLPDVLDNVEHEVALLKMAELAGLGMSNFKKMSDLDDGEACTCGNDHGTDLAWKHLTILGSMALMADPTLDVYEVVKVIIRKQRDYGHNNILRYGLMGLLVRLSDKIARYINLVGRDAEPENESLRDTLIDMVGYTLIARMLMLDTFTLELSEDAEADE